MTKSKQLSDLDKFIKVKKLPIRCGDLTYWVLLPDDVKCFFKQLEEKRKMLLELVEKRTEELTYFYTWVEQDKHVRKEIEFLLKLKEKLK